MKKETCIRGHQLTDENRTERMVRGKLKYQGCKLCAQERSKNWYHDNQERESAKGKTRYLLNRAEVLAKMKERKCLAKYGITLQQRDEMLRKQENRCANPGCRREIPDGGLLDHNHETGENRGILCSQCNMVLGLVQESVSCLNGLEQYLREHGA